MSINKTLAEAFAAVQLAEEQAARGETPEEDVVEERVLSEEVVEDACQEIPETDNIDTLLSEVEFDDEDTPAAYTPAAYTPAPVELTATQAAVLAITDEELEEDTPAAYTPAPTMNVKGLDEKAVLVQLKRRMYSPYKRDEAESEAYGAGNVNKHLFEGKDNRVKKALASYSAVYAYVKDHTVPWSTGIDLLNIDHYLPFTAALRRLISEADTAVNDLVANWDAEVNEDLKRLRSIEARTGKQNLADPSDYPTATEVAGKFSIETRYMPVPTVGDFRVGISDEDKASLNKQLRDAEANATTHVLTQMMEPMNRAVDKLKVKIGDEGSIFRDSLIDNLVEVADRMARVNLSDDPKVINKITALKSMVSTYADNKDILRNSQSARQSAVQSIDSLMSQMKALV